MGSSDVRDLLTSFAPLLDYFAITTGDGRIKLWDTLKGELKLELADIISVDEINSCTHPEKGHLSVDYTCMKWVPVERMRKRKSVQSLLVLGTGSGDILAWDISSGQLKWRNDNCHPGGVNSITLSIRESLIYSAGADGMISKMDSTSGDILGKFRASAKSLSFISVSPDGTVLATASGQLKIFNCSDQKKVQKFSGHPGAVRCMTFTEDGKFILSSAVGERYVAIWKADCSKMQAASCVLAMEHPAVIIDSKCTSEGGEDNGLYVLAVSERGVCYIWHGKTLEELRNVKPTKISAFSNGDLTKDRKALLPVVLSAKLEGVMQDSSCNVFVAYGLAVKPSFQKLIVHIGTDINLKSVNKGILLPSQSHQRMAGIIAKSAVTALDRSEAGDALLPTPNIYDFSKKRKNRKGQDVELKITAAETLKQTSTVEKKETMYMDAAQDGKLCMEDRLKSLGVVKDEVLAPNTVPDTSLFNNINLETSLPEKKIKAAVRSMAPSDTIKLLTFLVGTWQSRLINGTNALSWIYNILIHHGHHFLLQEDSCQLLESLSECAKSKMAAVQPLLCLSGRLQLAMSQIGKALEVNNANVLHDYEAEDSEDDEEIIEDVLYGIDDTSDDSEDNEA